MSAHDELPDPGAADHAQQPASQPEAVKMAAAEIVGHLAGTRIFSLLDPGQLAALAPVFFATRYGPGETLARQGQVDATLWVVASGGVSLDRRSADGRVEHAGYRGYGGVVGQTGVFTGQPRETTAVSLQPTELLFADRDELWSILGEDPGLLDQLVLDDDVRQRLRLPGAGAATQGERAVAVYRRHWAAFARSLLIPVVLVLASFMGAGAAATFAGSPGRVAVLAVAGLVLPVAATAWAFLNYWYDVLILTTRRIIYLDKTPMVRERRVEAPLIRVQDVVVIVPSLAARWLGYGTVVIQTAGTRGVIRFDMVADPDAVREHVFSQAATAADTAQRERQAWIAEKVAEAVRDDSDSPAAMPGVGAAPVTAPETVSPVARLVGSVTSVLPRMRWEDDGAVVWRKHWWVLVRHMWLVTAALVAVGAGFLHTTHWGGPVPASWWGALALVLGAWLAYGYEDWRNDLYVLTDEHIVDIERQPIGLYSERRQARLVQIQDIGYSMPNPLAVLLNYGDVHVETAAEGGRFTFDRVHDPAGVQEDIFERLERLRSREERAAEDKRADEMGRWLREYHRLAGVTHSPVPRHS